MLHSGNEDTVLATQHDAATPAPVDVDQAMNDINEIVSTLGEAVAALNNALATKIQAEMVAAVFAALYEAAASKDSMLAAAANDGLELVQDMNDINAIVTTLGNAIARRRKNSFVGQQLLPLWGRLVRSNNASAANAAHAIYASYEFENGEFYEF